ncbi:HPP family protein, partial [Bacillus luti]|uniref:HPP family protein n=1 Tax=Bacillus luti TaxID=2026191 RepID=UPI00406A35DE
MDAVISKKETIISYSIAFIFILAMVIVGVLLNDPEVILPEIAAMAVALWAYREPGWLRQPDKIFIAPSITAVIGFMVNQMDIAYLGKVSLTLVLMMLFLRIIQSNLAPSIATGLLPLVTNATEWSFVIAVFALTFILMIGVLIFKLNQGLE